MRFNTVNKRRKVGTAITKELIRQGYMYNNSAQEITDKWIEKGVAGFSSEIVKESLRLATLNYVYNLKSK